MCICMALRNETPSWPCEEAGRKVVYRKKCAEIDFVFLHIFRQCCQLFETPIISRLHLALLITLSIIFDSM